MIATIYLSNFILILSLVSGAEHDEFNIVQTEYGSIRGKLMTTIYESKPFYSYRGIPYAKAPLNELRFKVIHRFR